MTFLRFQRSGMRRRPTLVGQAVAWLAVGLIGLLVWLAADPEAHERFHPDAAEHAGGADQHDEHHCVVTDFASGCTDLAVMAVFMLLGLRLLARLPVAAALVARPAAYRRHAPSCGPPVGV